jgi:ABC-type transport system involved in multi-copper enzyme maturation permease subunit
MTWLTFRQFRAQAITALAAIAVLAAAYGYTGPRLADLYNKSALRGCGNGPHCLSLATTFLKAIKADQLYPALYFAGILILVILPAVIGAFWGAPLVARELEAGTYRLAWNQDVTRTRWMAVKLGLVGLAAIATSGLISLLFSWWAWPINAAGGFPDNLSQFTRMTPLMFIAQGVVPAAWAALAFVIGVVMGILVRRTIAAMAIPIVVVVLLQFLWPNFIRSHLLPPARATAPVTLEALNSMLVSNSGRVAVAVNQPGTRQLPGAWVLSSYTVTPADKTFYLPGTPSSVCAKGSPAQCDAWIAGHHLTQVVEYQPASNFWPLQWIETAVLLIFAAGLGGVAIWRTRRLLT